jgi:hypothetical protein
LASLQELTLDQQIQVLELAKTLFQAERHATMLGQDSKLRLSSTQGRRKSLNDTQGVVPHSSQCIQHVITHYPSTTKSAFLFLTP